jgi:hypothetical protein
MYVPPFIRASNPEGAPARARTLLMRAFGLFLLASQTPVLMAGLAVLYVVLFVRADPPLYRNGVHGYVDLLVMSLHEVDVTEWFAEYGAGVLGLPAGLWLFCGRYHGPRWEEVRR